MLLLSAVLVQPAAAAETTLLSISSAGTQAAGLSNEAGLSANGRFVAFTSTADNLVADDDNSTYDVFVRDRK